MAYAYNSGRSLTSIRESLNRLQQSVFSTRKSAESVSKSLKESNVAKRRNITNSAKFFKMRRESIRRKEREALVEASSPMGAIRRTSQSAVRSTKGFLGRIMDFLGSILIGWAVVNLPKIIKLLKIYIRDFKNMVQFLENLSEESTIYSLDSIHV